MIGTRYPAPDIDTIRADMAQLDEFAEAPSRDRPGHPGDTRACLRAAAWGAGVALVTVLAGWAW